ncbi:thioredoxin [Desulfonatronum thiosulfatophilum]|uniref:Thioredoxin n=1 Tax=Desulfonatronum thiosulfatophilum TaxID=617002 RepID=A0A1G6AB72_9BACT|nr:thioredoxin TrxC [Desulfonatronum thiosulfatophilum]SDB05641.1 thioredoxin [Desulfonatronum thiosulfatophilum]
MSSSTHLVCPSCASVNKVDSDRIGKGVCGRCRSPLFEPRPIELSGDSFHRYITRTDIPVLVDFWAPWCSPCKMMAPAFEEAARALFPKVRLAKLNTQDAPQIGQEFGIQSIPTMVIFRNGKEKARFSGAVGASQIEQWVMGQI